MCVIIIAGGSGNREKSFIVTIQPTSGEERESRYFHVDVLINSCGTTKTMNKTENCVAISILSVIISHLCWATFPCIPSTEVLSKIPHVFEGKMKSSQFWAMSSIYIKIN